MYACARLDGEMAHTYAHLPPNTVHACARLTLVCAHASNHGAVRASRARRLSHATSSLPGVGVAWLEVGRWPLKLARPARQAALHSSSHIPMARKLQWELGPLGGSTSGVMAGLLCLTGASAAVGCSVVATAETLRGKKRVNRGTVRGPAQPETVSLYNQHQWYTLLN